MSIYINKLLRLTLGVLVMLSVSGCSSVRSIGKFPSKKKRGEFAQYANFHGKEFYNLYEDSDPMVHVDSARVPLEKKIRKYNKRDRKSVV